MGGYTSQARSFITSPGIDARAQLTDVPHAFQTVINYHVSTTTLTSVATLFFLKYIERKKNVGNYATDEI